MDKREPGFYWVKFQMKHEDGRVELGPWQVGEWNVDDDCWNGIGTDRMFRDYEFLVGPPIYPPVEVIGDQSQIVTGVTGPNSLSIPILHGLTQFGRPACAVGWEMAHETPVEAVGIVSSLGSHYAVCKFHRDYVYRRLTGTNWSFQDWRFLKV